MASTGRLPTRAAASSIASGIPSGRAHTPATTRAFSAVSAKSARRSCARQEERYCRVLAQFLKGKQVI
jgi:hypothetical protein